ncbi:MAG: hypothetical protein JWP03_185 [Phycisphaerales bacterium]|nr:hypothetical protein [Phycisphaerales bacterium]
MMGIARKLLAGGAFMLLLQIALAAAPASQDVLRSPVPDAAAQAAAQKVVRGLFKAEYALHSASDRTALAGKLLKAASESGKEPATQYVLLREARDLGLAAGDPDTTLRAVEELAAHFAVDGGALQLETLTGLTRQASGPDALSLVADAAMALVEKAAADSDYDAVARFSPIAEMAAAKTHSSTVAQHVQSRLKELKDARFAFERVKSAEQALAKDPDDPEANAAVGKYLWLQKRDLAAALPSLAKGSDKELKALAEGDLAVKSSDDVEAASARGDAWWRYAGAPSGSAVKIPAERRAAWWYGLASAHASGLRKIMLDKRIEQAETDAKAYSTRHVGGTSDPARIRGRRDAIERLRTTPVAEHAYKGEQLFAASLKPYEFTGSIQFPAPATITVEAGAELRGGTFEMKGNGHVIATGTKEKPVVFRHMTFNQDLGASLKAEWAIFDDCRFVKNGGWFASYSSKWQFTSCVLYRCKFSELTEVDYGFQLVNCAVISMDWPEIKHPHDKNKAFSHIEALHGEWNKISSCEFIDCAVPPTVAWCAESSNFRGCKFIPGEAFESFKPLEWEAFVTETIGPKAQSVWASVPPKHAAVKLAPAPAPFATLPLDGFELFIPELIPGDNPRVVKSHFSQ